MSIEALKWALDIGEELDLDPVPRFILVALGNRADEEGYVYPSVRWIIKRTGYGERTVREHLKVMRERGLVSKESRHREDGGQTSNLYRLAMKQPGLPLESPPAAGAGGEAPPAPPPAPHSASAAPPGGRDAQGAPAARAPQEKKEEKKETKEGSAAARRTRLPAGFQISERVKRWYGEKGYPEGLLPTHLEKFLRTVKANGSKYVDWDEAFMNCVADDWGDIRRRALAAEGKREPAPTATSEWWQNFDGVRAKAAELKVERRDMPGAAPWENNLWFKAMVCATAGDGPWCNDRDEVFQRYLHVARKGLVHA
jgi:DNA-binding transcriptional ArsR family regulator